MWAKGQWAPFRQEPLAKKTQGVCARPGRLVPAARGLAAPLDWAAAGGGAGGLAGPGAVVEGDVTPLGPAWEGVAAELAATVAGLVPAIEVAAPPTLSVLGGGIDCSVSAAIFAHPRRNPLEAGLAGPLGSP